MVAAHPEETQTRWVLLEALAEAGVEVAQGRAITLAPECLDKDTKAGLVPLLPAHMVAVAVVVLVPLGLMEQAVRVVMEVQVLLG